MRRNARSWRPIASVVAAHGLRRGSRPRTGSVGIVGLGRIGQRIAEKCASLGMPVGYYGRSRRVDSPYAFHDDLLGLAAASDVLVLACAVTEHTPHIVDRDVLAMLGPDGILVNISRGAVVDEAALIDALERKTLGGAALDVFASEPHLLSFAEDEQKSAEFLSVSPNGKIPAIVDPDGPGGAPLALFESGAILLYLAEKTGRFMPTDPIERWEAMQWLMFQVGGVGPMVGQCGFSTNSPEKSMRTSGRATATRQRQRACWA